MRKLPAVAYSRQDTSLAHSAPRIRCNGAGCTGERGAERAAVSAAGKCPCAPDPSCGSLSAACGASRAPHTALPDERSHPVAMRAFFKNSEAASSRLCSLCFLGQSKTRAQVFDLAPLLAEPCASGESPSPELAALCAPCAPKAPSPASAAPSQLCSAAACGRCKGIADCLRDTGALLVRDPRCGLADSNEFVARPPLASQRTQPNPSLPGFPRRGADRKARGAGHDGGVLQPEQRGKDAGHASGAGVPGWHHARDGGGAALHERPALRRRHRPTAPGARCRFWRLPLLAALQRRHIVLFRPVSSLPARRRPRRGRGAATSQRSRPPSPLPPARPALLPALKCFLPFAQENRATVPEGPDPKWRFFWRIGPRPKPANPAFEELNAPPVLPAAFPQACFPAHKSQNPTAKLTPGQPARTRTPLYRPAALPPPLAALTPAKPC